MKIIYTILISFLISAASMLAEIDYVSDSLVKSPRLLDAYEIGEIRFVGNDNFSDPFLQSIISSRETARSFPHKVLHSYYVEFRRNKAAPRVLVKEIDMAIKSLEHEIRYFDVASIEADTLALWHFYSTQGYHDIKLNYSVRPNSKGNLNVLTFHITEGSRYSLDTVVYIGLDELAPEVARSVNNIISRRKIQYFEEMELIREVNSIHDELLNNGYYHASFEKPIVSMDTAAIKDSITIVFNIGTRVRIGAISYIDSTKKQHIVTHEMKYRQLEFKENQWYSRRKVNNSIDNLLSLGTFETVSIDTCRNSSNISDTILNFCIGSMYRKQKEWGVALFGNHTQLSNHNAGVEGSISHRNIFGNAQKASFFANFSFRDIVRIFERGGFDNLDYEMQIGTSISQPLLWLVGSARVGASAGFSYSVRTVNNFFQINTINMPIRFPINLSKRTYFNTMNIDFIFERENPVNFMSAVSNALRGIDNTADSLRFIESFYLYNNLHQYLQEPTFHLLTSNTIGFSLIGDNKNHPFNPTKGTYTFISLDGWNIFLSHPSISGIARFFRVQFLHSQYFPVNNSLTGAYKVRFGAIHLMDEANTYVPVDKQFFAGGSNSVRGWASRTLRYSKINQDSLGSREAYRYLQNFIGNGGLLEGSIEMRYEFSRPRGFSEFIAEHIGNLGITAFLDIGNAFHWYLGIEDMKMKFYEYFTNLAAAFGVGLRYNSPIGPFRIDVATPIYDPLGKEKPFKTIAFHFGIGHAF